VNTHPHGDQPLLRLGEPLESAAAALILLHGRGSSAREMRSLGEELAALSGAKIAYLAPNAAGNTWYPYRFIEPTTRNEPYLSSALHVVADAIAAANAAGVPTEKVMLLGFSQGACLALEYAARNPQRYGAVFGLSGGLIGATLPTYTGSLANTPVLLGCSDVDFHIPLARVQESAKAFRALGANVDERIYPNMGHTINEDEMKAVVSGIKEVAT